MPKGHRIAKAVVPAAGFGTRMLLSTKALPKEMLPVAGKPLIQYAVEEAAASGIETVILIVRKHQSLIQSHFAPDPELELLLQEHQLNATAALTQLMQVVNLQFVRQEKPLGLAHAISCARPLLEDEPFAVLLPDVIITASEPATLQLIGAHTLHGGSVVAVREVEPQDVRRHGIVRIGPLATPSVRKSVRVTGLVEKPSLADAPSNLGIFGRYILEPAIWDAIARTNPDARSEVQLTDALNLLCQTSPLHGLYFEGQHHDAGDRVGFLKANIELSLRDSQLRQTLLEYLSHLKA